MQANNARRNPFAIAPVLALAVIVSLGIIGWIPIGSLAGTAAYLTIMLVTLLIFGAVCAVFFYLRGIGAVARFGFRRITKRGLWVTFLTSAAVVLQSAVFRCGFFADSYDYRVYELYGVGFETQVSSVGSFFLILFALVILPAFFEELFFRGIMIYEYRFGGFPAAALMSSLFYAFVSAEFSRFPLAFLNGILFSVVIFVTGNLFCAMLSHTLCGVFAVFFEKYLWFMASEPESRYLFFLIFVSLWLLSLLLLFHVSEALLRERGEADEKPFVRVPKGKLATALYDMTSVPLFWADILCFAVFAILHLFL